MYIFFWAKLLPLPTSVRASCMYSPQGCQDFVYTNYTYIPGEPTLPDEMYDTDCSACKSIEETKERKHPWNAPGTAPTYGNGCGANGGNPNGCMLPGVDDRPYGSCCVYV